MSPGAKPFGLAVNALVLNPEGKCLVIRRAPGSKRFAGLWDLPGGKCDVGESMEAALRREVAEETGLDVRLRRVVGSTQWELPHVIVASLLMEAETSGDDVQLSDEHDEFRWVSLDELAGLAFAEHFTKILTDYRELARRPPDLRPFDKAWYQDKIEQYRAERPQYSKLGEALVRVLQQAAGRLGIHAIVQARAKTIASFAEKIQRPGKHYADPLREMTDLCGARVITHTVSEVDRVCRFIEKHFRVYFEDSGDKLESLAAVEFGYLSRHYVVSFKTGVFPAEDVPPEVASDGLKAEIQVRTILQHAWAAISHELSYKNRFRLPRRWQRELARLAAVLEEADHDFEGICAGLEEYASSYGAYYCQERLREEIDKYTTVLEADPTNAGIAHHLARMAMSLEDWKRAVDVLQPFAEGSRPDVLRDLGVSTCKLHRKNCEGDDFRRGQQMIERAIELDPRDVDARASLAGTWGARARAAADKSRQTEYRRRAKQLYREAYEIDPSDPYPLGNYIEYEVLDHPDLDVGAMFRPSLESASRRCLAQAEVNVNMPWAYFDLGKFQLLLRQPLKALGYYAKGIDNTSTAGFLDVAMGSLETLSRVEVPLPGLDWSLRLLELAKSIRFGKPAADVPPPSPGAAPIAAPVVIVAGSCGRKASESQRSLFLDVFRDFRGTVISGGTAAGISELVGDLQAEFPDALYTIGYVPSELPEDVELDGRHREQRRSQGPDFSPLEPLRYWADLSASGVPTDQIRLLAIGGGRLTAAECQIALALGVRIAVTGADGGDALLILEETGWLAHPNCRRFPLETAALRDFVQEAVRE